MRWYVEISEVGQGRPTQKLCLEAAHWQPALQAARRSRGEDDKLSGLSVEFLDDGCKALDATLRLSYRVSKAPDDAPLVDGKDAPRAGAEGERRSSPDLAKRERPSRAGRRSRRDKLRDSKRNLSSPLARPGSSDAGSRPIQKTMVLGSVGEVEDDDRELRDTADFGSPGLARVSGPPGALAPDDPDVPPPPVSRPVPKAEPPKVPEPAKAKELPSPKAEPPKAEPPKAPPPKAEPPKPAPPKPVPHEVLRERRETTPLRYAEEMVMAELPLALADLERLARSRLEALQAKDQIQLARIAVFDHGWDERPLRPPIATLEWSEWRTEPSLVFFPYAAKPAASVAEAARLLDGYVLESGKVPAALPPKVEAPKVEAPKVEAPKVEPPKVEPPKVEPPKEAVAAKAESPAAKPNGAGEEAAPITPRAGSGAARLEATPAVTAVPPAGIDAVVAPAAKIESKRNRELRDTLPASSRMKIGGSRRSIGERKSPSVAPPPDDPKPEPPKKLEPAPSKAEPAKAEPAKAEPAPSKEPAKAEHAKAEPAKVEPVKVEPAKAEPAREEPPAKKEEPPKEEPKTAAVDPPKQGDPPKSEPAKAEPAKAEPAKAEPAKAEPVKAEPTKAEPAKKETPKPAKAQPAKAQPAKAQPAKAQPAEPAKAAAKLPERRVKLGGGDAKFGAREPDPLQAEPLSRGERDQRMVAARARTASVPPRRVPEGERVAGEDLLTDLFEAMSELSYLNDAVEGAEFVLRTALEKLPCEVGMVSLFDIDTREFVVVGQRGGAKSGLLLRIRDSADMAKRAMRLGRSLVVHKPKASELDERWGEIGITPTSLICSPVERAGRYLGLIELANPSDGKRFSDADGHAVTYISEQFGAFLAERGVLIDPDAVAQAAVAHAASSP
jgi:hypothetical protein